MASAAPVINHITDLHTQLEAGHRYLLTFDLPGGIPPDVLRKLSDYTNMARTFLGQYGKTADVDLLGTTVAENIGGTGQNQLLALVRITGTPLLAAVTPIVAIALIVAGVYLVIKFRHAIDVTLRAASDVVENAAKTVGDVGDSLKQLAGDVGEAVKETGGGLKYGLPILAVGASILLVMVVLGYTRAATGG